MRLFLYKIAINDLLSPFLMLYFYPYHIVFFYFCVFLYIIMCTLNISRAIKRRSFNEIRDFIFENYYQRISCSKENNETLEIKYLLLLAKKLIEKIPDSRNAKKKKKSVRQSKITVYQSKTFENPNSIYIK